MLQRRAILGAVILAFVGTVGLAQEGKGPGPSFGGPGPGFGGPGAGGFGPGGPGFGFGMFGGGPNVSLSSQFSRLLNSPTVQKELQLTDEQKTKIKEAGDKAQAAMREAFSGMRDLSDAERRAKMEEMGKKMQAQSEETNKMISGTLLPEQLERLKGIALQGLGVQALNDKEVQKDLKLEDYQTAALRIIQDHNNKKTRELFSSGDRQSFGPKMQEIRKLAEKQMLGILTDEQAAAFEKMKGPKLEVPPSEMFGFGRRGPGGPGRRSGPGGPGPGAPGDAVPEMRRGPDRSAEPSAPAERDNHDPGDAPDEGNR